MKLKQKLIHFKIVSRMRFSAVYFVLLLFVVAELEATTCFTFNKEKKLSEFKTKVHEKIQKLSAPASSSETKKVRLRYMHIAYFPTDFINYFDILMSVN